MSKSLHPLALFRLSVLGPLASRGELKRGELKLLVRDLAKQPYSIPNSSHARLSEKTILRWYYDWQRNGIEALIPKERCDKGQTQLTDAVQSSLMQLKQDNPSRSINTMINMLEERGEVAKGKLARATVHRFLQQKKISKRIISDRHTIERRSFVAAHAGDIWHGDVMHGPSIQTPSGMRKVYLVSLMDDASRVIMHSAFCLGETALDIEGVLKQAIRKRGIPRKLIIDNGPAYRAESLQSICATFEIKLVYCRPYEPEGKGKLERFHRTFREQFLGEININQLANIDELNARLWAWLEHAYHRRPHEGLQGRTPLDRWRDDLIHVRALGQKAERIDDLFCHRVERVVRKDGTVSWEGKKYEVPYEYAGERIVLVVDSHAKMALKIESLDGNDLGLVAPLNALSNLNRTRQRPHAAPPHSTQQPEGAVEQIYQNHQRQCGIELSKKITTEE